MKIRFVSTTWFDPWDETRHWRARPKHWRELQHCQELLVHYGRRCQDRQRLHSVRTPSRNIPQPLVEVRPWMSERCVVANRLPGKKRKGGSSKHIRGWERKVSILYLACLFGRSPYSPPPPSRDPSVGEMFINMCQIRNDSLACSLSLSSFLSLSVHDKKTCTSCSSYAGRSCLMWEYMYNGLPLLSSHTHTHTPIRLLFVLDHPTPLYNPSPMQVV